jgi:hypothetical protein
VILPDRVFEGCTSLRSVAWPAGLSSVGDSCFEGCGLEVVDWGRTRVRAVGRRAFLGCGRLSMVRCSRELERLGSQCFSCEMYSANGRGCPLEELDLAGTSVTEIGAHACASCDSLVKVPFSPSLMIVGRYAFGRCIRLSSVDMSSTRLASLSACAFYGCRELAEVCLPCTLIELGNQSLADTAVRRLDLRGTKCVCIGCGALDGCPALREVLLPKCTRTLKE